MIEFANEGEMLTVGKLLQNERERQELTLEDIADRTKVHVKYLKAIEEEREDLFPGELYYELFTKSYAEALGLEYAKIKAGTFAMKDLKEKSAKASNKKVGDDSSTTARGKAKAKSKSADGKRSPAQKIVPLAESPDGAGGVSASDEAGIEEAVDSKRDSLKDGVSKEESTNGAQPDMVKFFLIIAAVIFCLLIIVVYISMSSKKPEEPADRSQLKEEVIPADQVGQSGSEDQLPAVLDTVNNVSEDNIDTILPNDRIRSVTTDSLAEGPVWIYPESLEVVLISTEESWASVVADGDTIFTSFFQPDKPNLFKALTELDFSLGRWEYISGSIYGHPIKSMRSFHRKGNNAVRLHITKKNWESLIDSTKIDHE